MSRRRGRRIAAVVVTVGLFGAACSASNDSITDEFDITVFGPWRGTEAEAFRGVLADFETETGITVSYTGTSSFADDLTERATTADLPDVGLFPQPGLLLDLEIQGSVLPMPVDLEASIQRGYAPKVGEAVGWLSGAAGFLYRMNLKSLVWYPPRVFDTYGYAIPRTWAEMEDLAREMVSDGQTPWCLGLESFGASGWPATDWVEDIVLRFHGTDTYDQWLWNGIAFTDERIAEAFETFETTTLFENSTVGGRADVLNTSPQDAHAALTADPPSCLMDRQASFAAVWMSDDTRIGPDGDVDFFELPGTDVGDVPLLVGGVFVGAMRDSEAVWQLVEYLASPQGFFESPGAISPNAEALAAAADDDPITARLIALLDAATVVRFDGSDVMYPDVGTDSFLTAMLSYVGTGRLDDALEIAQSGWDRLPEG